jgi:tetratricopeptide (TPR) repeat protein
MDVIESPRIDELRRRLQKDPTSIAFAQLAEEFRRLGEFQESVNVCLAGLAHHPSYLSARVTLGRALMELGDIGDARKELEAVIKVAPDNLAAIRALAEIHQRRPVSRDDDFEVLPTAARETPAEQAVPAISGASTVATDALIPPAVAESSRAATGNSDVHVASPGDSASEPAPPNPVLEELERWLAAIEAERLDGR